MATGRAVMFFKHHDLCFNTILMCAKVSRDSYNLTGRFGSYALDPNCIATLG